MMKFFENNFRECWTTFMKESKSRAFERSLQDKQSNNRNSIMNVNK